MYSHLSEGSFDENTYLRSKQPYPKNGHLLPFSPTKIVEIKNSRRI